MKLGNCARISLPTRQNGVENRDKFYWRQFYKYGQKKGTTEGVVAQLFLVQLEKMAGDRFHMTTRRNLVPRALFPGFSRPAPKAGEKRPGDEVGHGGYIGVQNNGMAAMFVYQKRPVVIELFSHVKTFFCSKKFA